MNRIVCLLQNLHVFSSITASFQALEYARKIRDDRGKAMIVVVGQGEEKNDMTEEELEVCTMGLYTHFQTQYFHLMPSSTTELDNISCQGCLRRSPSAIYFYTSRTKYNCN